jgi:hypothetical protein
MAGVLFVQQLRTENRPEMLPVFRMGVQEPLHRDNSHNMRQLQGTIVVGTNFFDIYVLNYNFLSSNNLSISLCITT